MEFNANKAIYLQIAEYVCDHILMETWKTNDKLPSVRELAVQLEVNPNTVMRTYDMLQQKEIIANKRGIGFFLTGDSVRNVKSYRKIFFWKRIFHCSFGIFIYWKSVYLNWSNVTDSLLNRILIKMNHEIKY
ncbi:GntR family transcriptional regulator [Sphingobacterium sp. E70]|uniref:GntR family transcriptional regulator n=1 Tax=Sphingobacterium sp. E70 TaxID=2853439 RepID=UPI00211BAB3E|nr:GntR family transcriptional regulator [Sphingobacterium sp. E70]ULT24033.1 GntR family transcriptional regulator [Sphingobacterium sp. E70]